jgi:hypothetical protein
LVLLGVNSDHDRDVANEAVQRHGINWRSWFAGGPEGDIPRQWGITNWPSIFVIDARGIVRHRAASFHDIERIVEPLLGEVE